MPIKTANRPTMARLILNEWLQAVLTRPAAPLVAAPRLRLYTAVAGPISPDLTPSDFTEASFDGYAAVTPTVSGVVNSPSAAGLAIIVPGTFVMTGTTTLETILGWYFTDSTTQLVCAEAFDVPVPLTVIGDFIDLQAAMADVYVPAFG